MGTVHFSNPSIHTPSSALRITLNDGEGSYFGEKYKVEKVLRNDVILHVYTFSRSYMLLIWKFCPRFSRMMVWLHLGRPPSLMTRSERSCICTVSLALTSPLSSEFKLLTIPKGVSAPYLTVCDIDLDKKV